MNQDEEHLRLLTIFHYVVAAMAGLFALFPVIHLIVGLVFIFAPRHSHHAGGEPPEFLGWFFVIFAGLFILLGLTMAILILIAGRSLAKRKHYTFCQIMAGVECLFMPFGTVLGVFTLIVLTRPAVRQLFGVNHDPPVPPAG